MKVQTVLGKTGWPVSLLLAGVSALLSGCVEEHDIYVHRQPAPVVVQPAPPEPFPAPVPAPPPPEVVVMAPAPVPPPAPLWVPRSGEELERMVAAIALYPDPLLAQVLPAATLPSEIVLADRYVREGGDLNAVEFQPWDRSVQALTRYPEVLSMLDNNLAWTTDLGFAFLNQPGELMDAVQRLRARAYELGNLRTCPEQVVYVQSRVIEIVPAAPAVIYVPVYVPEVVYVQRPPVEVRVFVNFGPPHPVGVWLNHDCDWQQRRLVVWHHDNPRPADWWVRPPERRHQEERHLTAWRARPVAEVAQARGGDRGWGTPVNRPVPAPAQSHPAPVQTRRAPPQPQPPIHSGAHLVPPTVQPAPAPVQPPVHSGAHPVPVPAPQQPSSGAFDSRPIKPAPPSSARPAPPADTGVPAPPSSRPILAPKEPTPPPVRSGANPRPLPATPAPAPKPQPVNVPARERPVPVSKPAPGLVQPRPTGGALTGVESARETKQFSNRGQQSRETMGRTAPPSRPTVPPGQAKEKGGPEPKRNPNSR